MEKFQKRFKSKMVAIVSIGLLVLALNHNVNAESAPGLNSNPENFADFINKSSLTTLSTATAEEDEAPRIHVGGAVRYNVLLRNYESDIDGTSGNFTWDTWRVNFVVDNPGGIGLNFEYRFYPTFDTHFIKQGWLEYNLTEQTQAQLGVTQVPFGNLQYNSNNWWFQLPYYLGYEDDHNMGLKFTNTTDDYQLDFAYFYTSEPFGPPGASGTYSYNVIPGQASLSERNQFNLRGAYNIGTSEIGASLELGQLYNSSRDEFDGRFAGAVHANLNLAGINLKPQFLYYNWDAHDNAGNPLETVTMGAYGIPYEVATEGYIATLGIARSVDVSFGPVSNITFYNDFSYMGKLVGEEFTGNDNFEASIHNITGFLVSAGPVFTYFDIAQGVNQPWLTDQFGVGLGPGHGDDPNSMFEESEFNVRFNINIGYYF